jgi:hypothetical protein
MRKRFAAAAITASIFFSTVLLLTDPELWTVAPFHAYVLIGLTGLDVLMLTASLRGSILVARIGVLYGLGKLALFLGDIFTAPEFGTTYWEFASYLFSLWAYDGLLASQIGIVAGSYLDRRQQRR